MWIDISGYQAIIHISDYFKGDKNKRVNAGRAWNAGRQDYLRENETAMKIGRDWYVLSSNQIK